MSVAQSSAEQSRAEQSGGLPLSPLTHAFVVAALVVAWSALSLMSMWGSLRAAFSRGVAVAPTVVPLRHAHGFEDPGGTWDDDGGHVFAGS